MENEVLKEENKRKIMDKQEIQIYISNIKLPYYCKITLNGNCLKTVQQQLYLRGDIVFNSFDIIHRYDIKKHKKSIKYIIDVFVKNAWELSKTKPYRVKIYSDIDNVEYEPFGGWIVGEDGSGYIIY